MDELIQLSLRYEESIGCPPLIRLKGKVPVDRAWTSGPRQDPDGWRARLQGWPANVGMLTGAVRDGSFLVVVDVDLYVEAAEDSLDRLREVGLCTETPTVLTPGGGRHLYYRSPVAVPSGPLAGFPGIDVKGEGGMVVVPPSRGGGGASPYDFEDAWSPWPN